MGLIFAGGALTGGLTTWFAVKKYYEAKADIEIQEMEDYYKKKIEAAAEEKKTKEEYKEIAEMYDTVSNEPVEEPKKASKVVKKKKSTKATKEPYVISADEYADDDTYDKVIVSYFEDDEVLMLQDETIFDNGIMILGAINLEQFGTSGDGDDTVYIRNETFGTDYEVVLESGSYRQFIENQG